MPRELVYIPDPRVVTGAGPIGPGYTKDNTPEDMRGWAADLESLYRTMEADSGLPPGSRRVDQLRAADAGRLSSEARRLKDVDHRLMGTNRLERIEGDLGPDGRVELANGRHRAHYVFERGTTPVPVWVSSADQRELDGFRDACHSDVLRARPQLLPEERRRLLGGYASRVAVDRALEDPPAPMVRPFPERLEAERERGAFNRERGR
jgi:hypothetical protein